MGHAATASITPDMMLAELRRAIDLLQAKTSPCQPPDPQPRRVVSRAGLWCRRMLQRRILYVFGCIDAEPSIEQYCFLNPFRLAFCEHLRGAESSTSEELKKAGLRQPQGVYSQLSNELILSQVADSLQEQMKEPMTWKDFQKVTWLYDKVAKQVGWPLSNTIQRIPA
jgi:hypothetical protein